MSNEIVNKITVVDWIHYSQAENHEEMPWDKVNPAPPTEKEIDEFIKAVCERKVIPQAPLWDEYCEEYTEETKQYLDAIKQEIISNKIRFGGFGHQYDSQGVPVFSDGKIITLSMRSWGGLLASIWNTEEGEQKYSYCTFAWYGPGED